MSKPIDTTRRQLISLGLLSGITLFISAKVDADPIGDLIAKQTMNQIISVRIWPSDVYSRLTIEANHEIKAKYFTLDSPKRFVIDVLNSELNAVLKQLNENVLDKDPMIKSIKVGQFDPTTARIVIYLKHAMRAQTQTLSPINTGSVNYKYRYVFDMYPDNLKNPSQLNDQLLAMLQIDADQSTESQAKSSRRDITPEFRIPNGKIANKNNKPSGKILVMLDPGHGGEDPGAIGPQGTKEKNVVLDIAKRLRALINATDYMYAQMTRTSDIFIPLATRVAMARKIKADMFISIHADAFTTPVAKGSSVFILSESGASSSSAKWLAQSQNNADLIGGMSFKSKDKVVNKILFDMTQSYTLRKSSRFGQILLTQMKDVNQLHSKQVERAGFAVLKAPDIPSVLVETAFISNPQEEAHLLDPDFRQEVAVALCDGIGVFAKNILTS